MVEKSAGNFDFVYFKSFEDFGLWYDSLAIKNVYEIITDTWQKPYFDLEHEKPFDNWDQYVNDIIYSIRKLYDDPVITVYQSHGEHKYSQHIVVQSLKVKNAKEARKFALSVLNDIEDPSVFDIVDMSMYKRKQAFRIDKSSKFGQFRYKTKINNEKSNVSKELVSNVIDCVEIQVSNEYNVDEPLNYKKKWSIQN